MTTEPQTAQTLFGQWEVSPIRVTDLRTLPVRQRLHILQSCHRWQLYFCSVIYEVSYFLDMHQEVLLPASKPGRPLISNYRLFYGDSQFYINVLLKYDYKNLQFLDGFVVDSL